ncbi:thiol reductant ABC exporter subunit CydD [Fictibacillus sp. 7GRE50]|uniref:thiol reductant ABC exporter subunit CydD n=1 Tax=unclassified Fictibacillus TaxID=2644029 RepID=UPI0018CE12F9|nr:MULTISPECIES: thiol reductant ABC exporter subunit CydD [unclassified Fictibacillus]MBH0166875.1 thiol reductant ABC exporter subunit CydD [Fictibacillus sp. 7GRE50]MBH0173503.1 thiol reductant ABC exporter subunit CydD [Fictibacillus sp. 23RED33]
MKQIRKMAFEQKKWIRRISLYAVLTGLAMVLQAYYFVNVVESVFLKSASFTDVISDLIILLTVSFIRVLVMYRGRKSGISLALDVKNKLRSDLLKKLSNNPIQTSLSGQTGRKVNMVLDAVDEMTPYFSVYIPQMLQTIIIPLIILIAVFSQHMISGFILLITAPFIPLAMALTGMKTKQKSEEQLEKLSMFSGHFLDVLQGLVTLKLYGRSKVQKLEIEKSSIEIRDASMKVLKIAFLSALSLEFISMLSIGLIAFELGLQIVVFKSVLFSAAFFILILVPDFYLLLKEYGSAFHAGKGSSGAAKVIFSELEKEEQGVKWGKHPFHGSSLNISLENTTFSYAESSFSLKSINMEIHSHQKIAIVGPNGSGKTTLLHILGGLLEADEGKVLINGKERNRYDEKSWFEQISYISQSPYIFSGTIAENISIGSSKKVDMVEIRAAAESTGLSSMIESLESGYNTIIGEGGRGLSGGEKQRLALARAFVKRPKFILFDEPTTGLDLMTESILQQSINELGENATIVTVAHRLNTIIDADQIYFIQNGKLMARGTHDELIMQSDSYREMITISRKEAVT